MGRTVYFFFFVLLTLATLISAAERQIKGYYWRDFEGIIPKDAFPAGFDPAGSPIYIGQVSHDGRMVPGKIYSYERQIRFAFDGERTDTRNVKILCTQRPENFRWVPTTPDGLSKLTNSFLPRGGFEHNLDVYLGRAFQSGETVVGKILCSISGCLGLYSALEGSQIVNKQAYEVLTFNNQFD